MTTAPLTVAFDSDGASAHAARYAAARYAAHRAALTALPGSFRVVSGQPADVLVTVAADTGWLARITALLTGPVKAVLVAGVAPSAVGDLRGLAALTADSRLPVVVDSGPADDAAWRTALPSAQRDLGEMVFIDTVATPPAGGCLFDALLGQLALVESLTGPLEQVVTLAATVSGYVLSAAAGSTAVSLSGTACAAEPGAVELDLIGARARWHAEFTAGIASPARIVRYDADGARAARPLFQGPQRAGWLRLRDQIEGADGEAVTGSALTSLIERARIAASVVVAP